MFKSWNESGHYSQYEQKVASVCVIALFWSTSMGN
jgi:hypothetical protein